MNYDYRNKDRNIAQLNKYMLTKTLSMFEWQGLPETIPVKELEKMLQVNGYAFITSVNGDLYAFNGGLGGVPDVYNNPTQITIANPALGFNETLSLDDGVLLFNDDMGAGLLPLFQKHNTLLAENDINMVLYGYATRMKMIISASDDRTKQSAEEYLKQVVAGEVGIIGENAFFDGVKVQTAHSSQGGSVSGLIEYHQYIKGTLLNEVGLSANFNLKKERLITSEVEQQNDGLYPLVYNMLKCRLEAVEALNEKYGLDVAVDFGSVWAKNIANNVDGLVEDITGGLTDEPADEITDEPADEITDEPTDESTDEITDESTDEITDEPANDQLSLIDDLLEGATEEDKEILNELKDEIEGDK